MQRTKHNAKVRLHEAPPKKILWHFPLWSIRALRYFVHFFCHHYEVKVPNVTFYGGRKTSDGETFFLVFLNMDMVLRIIEL